VNTILQVRGNVRRGEPSRSVHVISGPLPVVPEKWTSCGMGDRRVLSMMELNRLNDTPVRSGWGQCRGVLMRCTQFDDASRGETLSEAPGRSRSGHEEDPA
jgi:hypothetical protein